MAKELIFKLFDTWFAATPVKLERKKVHTDFSSGRKEMIKRDMLYSDDERQIRDLFAKELADNIKKGWEEVLL